VGSDGPSLGFEGIDKTVRIGYNIGRRSCGL